MDCVRTLYRTATASTPAKCAWSSRYYITYYIIAASARAPVVAWPALRLLSPLGFLLFSVMPQRLRRGNWISGVFGASNVPKRVENAPIPAIRPRWERKFGIMTICSSAMETRTQDGSRVWQPRERRTRVA